MADDVRVTNLSDGSHRVALDLFNTLAGRLPVANGEEDIKQRLTLFVRCRKAVFGGVVT